MIVRSRPRLVVLGRLTTMPYGGVVWQNLHYLLGFERLGFETYYVEAHAVTPRHFIGRDRGDGAAEAAAFLDQILGRFGFKDRWAFQALHSDERCYGMSEARLRDLYAGAEVVVNLHGGTAPRAEHAQGGRLVCIATDPVQLEVELNRKVKATIAFCEAHHAIFTFGENYGRPDCRLPVSPLFALRPTRQPVVLEHWAGSRGVQRDVFTTVANWRQRREMQFAGELYEWSKHFEFLKVIDLPQRTDQPLELALSRCPEEHRQQLEGNGWRVRDALEISCDPDSYRRYIATSRAELTVAKDQNVRLRSGWFSDRSATYLAAARPVVTQDTGFGNVLPTGEGLFAFGDGDQAVAAIEAINSDYPRHSRMAREIARACFAHDVVLPELLESCGVELPGRRSRYAAGSRPRVLLVSHRFPPDATGGVERYTEKLAQSLAADGHAVSVVARSPDAGPLRREVAHLETGVTVHRLAGGRVRRERFLMEREERERLLQEVLVETDPDVVHVNHVLDLSPGILRMTRERGAALVLTLHDYYFACDRIVLRTVAGEGCDGPRGGRACASRCAVRGGAPAQRWLLRTLYFRRLLGLPHRIACPSPSVTERFAGLGADPKRLRTVANGVWIERDSAAQVSWPTPRERGRLVLAFLGALLPHKGLQVLVQALRLACLDAVDLLVFGPVDEAARARQLYADAAEVPGLRLRLYGEYQPHELPALLQDIDCVVVPSQWPETFCLVAREALALGVPALVARMGALPDAVAEGDNGFVFAHDRPERLAELLRRLVDEPDLVARLRAGARRTPQPSQHEHLRAIQEVYREAIDEAAHTGALDPTDLEELAQLEEVLEAMGFGAPEPRPAPAIATDAAAAAVVPAASPSLERSPTPAADPSACRSPKTSSLVEAP